MWNSEVVTSIRTEMTLIRDEMHALEASESISVNDIAPHFRSSAANFLHYLALRRHDIRPLQMKLAAGMDCMRINCAHDGVAEWERMIENLRRARRELGKKCRVLMEWTVGCSKDKLLACESNMA